MTWSYSYDQLNSNPVYYIRDQIGDADSTDPLLQDEEIAEAVASNGSLYGAAADCCRKIANRFARKVDQAAGTMKLSFSQAFKAYSAPAIRFDKLATQSGASAGNLPNATSLFGGRGMDPGEHVPSIFKVGMHDNYLPIPPAGQERTEVEPEEQHE